MVHSAGGISCSRCPGSKLKLCTLLSGTADSLAAARLVSSPSLRGALRLFSSLSILSVGISLPLPEESLVPPRPFRLIFPPRPRLFMVGGGLIVIFTSSFSHFFFFVDSRGSLVSWGSPSFVSFGRSFPVSFVEAAVVDRERSSFSAVAATSGEGHASASSRAGGAILLIFVERRGGALTTEHQQSNRDELYRPIWILHSVD